MKITKMFWVYILKSLRTKKYYIGQTNNIERRIIDHNKGKDHSSKCGKPWMLVYQKIFFNRREAIKCEKSLKSLKNKKYLEKIIFNAG